ncbi:MAG: flagellar hook-basal body protein [Eubacterium sp.]|nr:flagellar hook-basal body protein [Eubacterium sp.]
MVKGLYTAWSGMVNEMNRMDVMTNNLANADTNGYKKEGATSTTFDEQLAVKIKDQSDMGLPVKLGGMYPGVKIGETYTDYSQGSFKVTDNQYDVALDGAGFFAISFTSKAGETSVKYTRDGAFTVNTQGYLVTKDGDYVLNQAGADNSDPGAENFIQLDPNLPFKIDELGYIWQDGVAVAQLGVIDFEDYNYLEKYGENMCQPVEGATLMEAEARVRQGYIEASNVNVVTEMVNMITITRAYESNQKVLQTMNGMLDKAVNSVGRV